MDMGTTVLWGRSLTDMRAANAQRIRKEMAEPTPTERATARENFTAFLVSGPADGLDGLDGFDGLSGFFITDTPHS